MTVIQLLVFLVAFAIVAYLAYWIISKFFPEPVRMPAFAIIGVILLLVLLSQFLPEASNYRIWR